jgi:hypothetical protein
VSVNECIPQLVRGTEFVMVWGAGMGSRVPFKVFYEWASRLSAQYSSTLPLYLTVTFPTPATKAANTKSSI